MIMRALLLLVATLAAVAGLATASQGAGCTITWDGGASGAWLTAANWTEDRLPTGNDRACIGAATVTLDNNTFVSSLELAQTATLNITGGTLVAAKDSESAGTITVSSGATLWITDFDNATTETLSNAGTLTGTGTLKGRVANTGAVTAPAGNTLLVQAVIAQQAGGVLGGPGKIDINGQGNGLEVHGGSFAADADVDLTGGSLNNSTGAFLSFVDAADASGDVDIAGGWNQPLSGAIPAGYTVNVKAGAWLVSGQNVTNAGTLRLDGANSRVSFEDGDNATGTTLTNTGTLAFPAGSGERRFAGDLDNQGTVVVATDSAVVQGLYESRAPRWTNRASLTVGAGGHLIVRGVLVQQSGGTIHGPGALDVDGQGGALEVHAGTVAADADVNLTGGFLNASSGAGLSFVGAGAATGSVDVSGGSQGVQPLFGDVPAGFTVNVKQGSWLFSGASFTNMGTIALAGNEARLRAEDNNPATTETLTNAGTITAGGAGTQHITGDIDNQGTITAAGAAVAFDRPVEQRAWQFVNEGTLDVPQNGAAVLERAVLDQRTGAHIQGAGSLTVTGGDGKLIVRAASAIGATDVDLACAFQASCPALDLSGALGATGRVELAGGFNSEGPVTGNVPAGMTLAITGAAARARWTAPATNFGTITTVGGGGGVRAADNADAPLTFTNAGSITGSGRVAADLVNSGDLAALTVTGNFIQTAAGRLSVVVPQTTLAVSGSATLDGELELDTPVAQSEGTTHDAVTSASRTGFFANVSGRDQGPWAVTYPGSTVRLTRVAPGEAGGPALSVAPAQVAEGDSGTTTMTFTAQLAAPATSAVNVEWNTVADTATPGSDYTESSGLLSFAAGEKTKTFTVPVIGDTTVEPGEQFLVRLRGARGTRLGVTRAAGTIVSDDLGVTAATPSHAAPGRTTMTLTGGGLAPASTVTLNRAGEPARTGTIVSTSPGRDLMVVAFDLTRAALGPWDLKVEVPGGATLTKAGALTVEPAVAGHVVTSVSAPTALRTGTIGRFVVTLRNTGNTDATIDFLRVLGNDVVLKRIGDGAFAAAPLQIDGGDPGDGAGPPIGTLGPHETRQLTIQFRSTTQVAHATLRLRAEVYEHGGLEAQLDRLVPLDADTRTAFQAPGRVTGIVKDPAGQPVAGIPVTLVTPVGDDRGATTGADGRFDFNGLADGKYQVGLGNVPDRSVTLTAGSRTADLTFATSLTELSGTVRRADGTPVAGGRLALYQGGELIDTVDVDGAGGFQAQLTAGGTFDLVARGPGIGLARLDGVVVTAGAPRTGLHVDAGAGRLEVSTAPGATVGVRPAGLKDLLPTVLTADNTGAVTFERLAAGPYVVTAQAAGKAPKSAQTTVAASGATPVALALSAGTDITGHVTGDGGAPLRDATVFAIDAASQTVSSARTDASGAYVLHGVAPGAVDLWFVAGGYRPAHSTGATDAALTRTGSTVPVRVSAGPAVLGAQVTVSDPTGLVPLASAMTDAEGKAQLGPLPAGTLKLVAQLPGTRPVRRDLGVSGRARRDLTDEQLLDLEPPPMLHRNPRGTEPEPGLWNYSFILNPPTRLGPDADPDWSGSFVAVQYPPPCPTKDRLKRNLLQSKINLDRAFADWERAYLAAQELNSAQVQLYLTRSALITAKVALLTRALVNFRSSLANPNAIPGANEALYEYMLGRAGTLIDIASSIRQGGSDGSANLGDPSTTEGGIFQGGLTGLVDAASGTPWAGAVQQIYSLYRDVENLVDEIDRDYDQNFLAVIRNYEQAESNYKNALLRHYRLDRLFRAYVCPEIDPEPDPPVPGPSSSGGSNVDNVAPNDPNDIDGPAGAGAQRWIGPDAGLGYTIRFENIGPGTVNPPPGSSPATAPAVLVDVRQVLDPGVDLDSFALGAFGWGDVDVTPPGGAQSYHGEVALADGDIVHVDAGLDRATRTVSWRLETIDPETGEREESPTGGFLPPEDGTGKGQGHVAYSVRLAGGAAQGATVSAQARIVFDTNDPIDTPTWTNTVDREAPVGSVTSATQAGCSPQVAVSWTGSDVGSGIAAHTILVTGSGGYVPWLAGTTASSATMPGLADTSYGFVDVPTDAAGNVAALPAQPDKELRTTGCDTVKPTIRIGAPVAGAQIARGASVAAEFSCGDDASGVASCVGTVASGAAVPADSAGTKTFTVTATDKAGNAATASRTYTVTEAITPVPPDFGKKLKVTFALGKVKKANKVPLTVRNGYGFPVTGRARLLLAKKAQTKYVSFSVAGGKRRTLTLKPLKALQKQLKRGRKVKVTLQAEVRNSAKQKRTVKKALTIKLKRKR